MFITVTAVKLDELNVNYSLDIEGSNIKYVFGDPSAYYYYGGGLTDIIYYDEQESRHRMVVCKETPYQIFKSSYTHFVLATMERIDGVPKVRPFMFNDNAIGYGVALSPKDPNSISIIQYGASRVGTFQQGETITDSTTLATAVILYDNNSSTNGIMYVHPLNGTIGSPNTITGATSTATAAAVTYTSSNQQYIQYEEGYAVSQKKKDIVLVKNLVPPDRAITVVDQVNRTFTVAGNHQIDFTQDVPFFVDGSTGNDGLYSVLSSTYDGANTVISVRQIIVNATADGTIKFS